MKMGKMEKKSKLFQKSVVKPIAKEGMTEYMKKYEKNRKKMISPEDLSKYEINEVTNDEQNNT